MPKKRPNPDNTVTIELPERFCQVFTDLAEAAEIPFDRAVKLMLDDAAKYVIQTWGSPRQFAKARHYKSMLEARRIGIQLSRVLSYQRRWHTVVVTCGDDVAEFNNGREWDYCSQFLAHPDEWAAIESVMDAATRDAEADGEASPGS